MSQSIHATMEIDHKDDITIIRFRENTQILDECMMENIIRELFALVDEQNRKNIIINFGNVVFMSASFISKLISFSEEINIVNGELVLCGMRQDIDVLFRITNLHKLFYIETEESVATALMNVIISKKVLRPRN